MAHQSMLRPDPSENHRPSDELSPPNTKELNTKDPDEADEQDAGLFLAHLATTLARHGGGELSADLALDLVLNEIVDQALLATTASGAAIALAHEGEMICRATSGANAPGLGIRLNTRSGLSGACILTRQVQRCDETEEDSRVDAAACRQLEARSILVLPVLTGEELIGVFEIFSPRPNAFSDRDIQTVEALSRRIVDNVRRAAETATLPPEVPVAEAEAEPILELPSLEIAARKVDLHPKLRLQVQPQLPPQLSAAPARSRDYWTGTLTAIVVALSLLLGWMVGRIGWQSAAGPNPSLSLAAPKPDVLPNDAASNASAAVTSTPATSTASKSDKKTPHSAALPGLPKPASQVAKGTSEPTGGLVVYENGKVIFQMAPVKKSHLSGASPAVAPVPVSPEVAGANIIQRVEPQYPEEARRQHIQGLVVLETLVGKDGIVREAKAVSGDSDLAAAAVDAVRQWRFKPYLQNGRPVEFETRVSVNFTLP